MLIKYRLQNLFPNKMIRNAHKYCLNDRKEFVFENIVYECLISSLGNCSKLKHTFLLKARV